jgi:hypothetical protein
LASLRRCCLRLRKPVTKSLQSNNTSSTHACQYTCHTSSCRQHSSSSSNTTDERKHPAGRALHCEHTSQTLLTCVTLGRTRFRGPWSFALPS